MLEQNPEPAPTGASPYQFTAVARLYDLLMTGVPYDDWVVYLRQLMDTRRFKPSTVLDLACGTGNVSELLEKEGYKVTGADIAPEMIAEAQRKAREHGLEIEYVVQDAAELTLPGRTFDMCVSLFDSLNYITAPERLQMAIHRVSSALRPGGLFIFDLNSEFALKNGFFEQDNLKYLEEALQYDWKSSFDERSRICRVDMQFWYRDETGARTPFEEVHFQFAYRTEEIVTMLQNAGFVDIAFYQAYTLRRPGRSADRIYYVANKPG